MLSPLIKYPVTLFVLLLIGYGQFVVPIFRASAASSSVKITKEPSHFPSLSTKAEEKEEIYFEEVEEEDDEQDSNRKYAEEYMASALLYSLKDFSLHIDVGLSFYKLFYHSSSLIAPYLLFCVIRL